MKIKIALRRALERASIAIGILILILVFVFLVLLGVVAATGKKMKPRQLPEETAPPSFYTIRLDCTPPIIPHIPGVNLEPEPCSGRTFSGTLKFAGEVTNGIVVVVRSTNSTFLPFEVLDQAWFGEPVVHPGLWFLDEPMTELEFMDACAPDGPCFYKGMIVE